MKKLLIIGQVWPEPTSSAAGIRMIQLIDCFLKNDYKIYFASAASKSDFSFDLKSKNIDEISIRLNDESFDILIKELNPSTVIFDRFMTEEQYSWRVTENCPNALKILDTEDLHFLRNARQNASKKNIKFTDELLYSDLAKREISAILRCDLSLIISKKEMEILISKFNISENILHYLPFLEKEIKEKDISNWKKFNNRKNLIFIGNFIHEPNYNCVLYLKTKIWPKLCKKLPNVEMHIYGAYATQKVLQLNNPKENFYIKERALDAKETMSNYKILLAPIQFGAGLKVKFIDAMLSGTPSVTTSLGSESMTENGEWNGFIADDDSTFIEKVILLYENEEIWQSSQKTGVDILNKNYNKELFESNFLAKVDSIKENLVEHRNSNFIGQILQYNTNQSTKYMSLWIEEKNKTSFN